MPKKVRKTVVEITYYEWIKLFVDICVGIFKIIINIIIGASIFLFGIVPSLLLMPNLLYYALGINTKMENNGIPLFNVHGLFDFFSRFINNNTFLAQAVGDQNQAEYIGLRVGLLVTDYERAIQIFYQIKGGRILVNNLQMNVIVIQILK